MRSLPTRRTTAPLHALHAIWRPAWRKGRSAWLEEDAARLLATVADDGERWPHLALRSAQFLDPEGQRRLLRLLRWRDAYARRNDRPRNWILDNELAVSISRANPRDAAALRGLLDATPKAPRSLIEPILDALATPLADEAEAPPARGDERDKTRLRRLQDAVASRASELGLAEGTLASRRLLESLMDGAAGHGPLAGWRRQAWTAPRAPAGVWRDRSWLRIIAALYSWGGSSAGEERHVRIVEVRGSIPLRSNHEFQGRPAPAFFCLAASAGCATPRFPLRNAWNLHPGRRRTRVLAFARVVDTPRLDIVSRHARQGGRMPGFALTHWFTGDVASRLAP